MKKNLWMLGMAVAALTSCTQSEVVDIPQSKLIGFDTHVDKSTRATNDILDSKDDDFKEFYVYGVKGTGGYETSEGSSWTSFTSTTEIFQSTPQKVTGGKEKWTYEPHASWISDKTFRFAAYANGKGDGTSNAAKLDNVNFISSEDKIENGVTTHVWGLDITNYTENGKDLVAAIPDQKVVGDITTAPPSVGLTFKHILAKVIIQFRTNNSNEAYSMHISDGSNDNAGIKFSASSKGNCKVRYTGHFQENTTVIGANWTSQSESKDYVFFAGDEDWTTGNIQQEFYVIPQDNSDKLIPMIVVDTKNAQGETTSSVTYENVSLRIEGHTNWLPGYVYRYIANVTPGEHYIHFTSSVNNWIDDDNRNHDMGTGTQQSGGTPSN